MELKDWFATNTYGENFIYIRQKRLPFFNVILCGITNPNPDYDVHFPDGCPCYILDYTLSGSGTISDEYGIHTLQEGSLLFIRKGVPVHFQANKDTPFKKIWIQMTGTFLKNMCALFQMPEGIVIENCHVELQMREIVTILKNTTPATVNDNMRQISVRIYEIFTLLRSAQIFSMSQENHTPAYQIRQILEEHIYSNISMQEISDALHLTVSHCIRLFKKQFEISPIQYLQQIRMEQAKILLLETEIPIKDIADRLCFYDSQHFSASFRKYYGLSPSQFRQKQKQPLL